MQSFQSVVTVKIQRLCADGILEVESMRFVRAESNVVPDCETS